MAEVKIMTTDSEIMETFSIMQQLRPHLMQDDFLIKIKRLQHKYDYTLVAVVVEGKVKSAAGFRITESLAWSSYLYVDDLITDENSRSEGYANLLFDWLDLEAKKNNCEQFHLDSGVQRHDAHRFYLRRKMDITCHHFQNTL
ncbi:MAG: N-acetyltransferase [Bacilli bacterium]|jgi:hypothetical protein|nr:N-acetyltransferase [Bacilli bacterium]